MRRRCVPHLDHGRIALTFDGVAPEEAVFLEAVKAERDDSDTREVYADWLEEQGDREHAEYLRLEAEVRGFDFITGNPERMEKKARRDALEGILATRDPKWLADVSRVARTPPRRPRPTDVGRAEVIPARPAPLAPEPAIAIANLLPSAEPLATRLPPLEPVPASRWGRTLFREVLVAIAIVLLVKAFGAGGGAQTWEQSVWEMLKQNGPM